MVIDKNNLASTQYIFGNFILNTDGILSNQRLPQQVCVPPKELAVLTTLLEAAGELVSKETLLDRVWPHLEVSEESLTRCIYTLRRLLQETKDCRYIDTIYGKGYRFSRPVATLAKQPEPLRQCQCSIAILPFRTHEQLNSLGLQDALVKCLSRYTQFGLLVLPTALTHNCRETSDIVTLIQQLRPDYYLAGQTLRQGNNWQLSVELVRSEGHQLVHHDSLTLTLEQPIPLLQHWLSNLLAKHIPDLRGHPSQTSKLGSLDVTITYLNGRNELLQHTPASLHRALYLLRQSVCGGPTNPLPYLALAECYLAKAQLGLFDQELALKQARQAITQATEIDASHPQTLGLLALMSSISAQQTVADVLFEQALLMAPDNVDIHYYHAWHLFLGGKLDQALQALNTCLKHDPSRISANILRLWIIYYTCPLDNAVLLGQQLLCQYGQDHPVLQSMLALLLAQQGQQGQHDQVGPLLAAVRAGGNECGLLAVNRCYIDYCLKPDATIPELRTFLAQCDSRHLRSSLLPLIQAAWGDAAAQQHWRRLEQKEDPWLRAWRHDPRLGMVVNALRPKEVAA